MKIVSIVGARPQFVKLAPLSKILRKEHNEVIVHTGQHYDFNLSKIFFLELEMPIPNYNLGVGSKSHGKQTSEILSKMEDVLIKEKPDLAIVFGDTNSTLAGSLAAAKLHIPIAHIEAGLRSFNRKMPEEINRILTDHMSDLLFAPTHTAIQNLENEGLKNKSFHVGDLMFDSLINLKKVADSKSSILKEHDLDSKDYFVLTLHRPENTDVRENLESIFEALTSSNKLIIFPIHPRTRKSLEKFNLLRKLDGSNVRLIPPLGHFDFIKLLSNSKKILTDSGGTQKEAYILKIPCVTIREETEWTETLKGGWNKLTGPSCQKILEALEDLEKLDEQKSFFGDGNAASKIIQIIHDNLVN